MYRWYTLRTCGCNAVIAAGSLGVRRVDDPAVVVVSEVTACTVEASPVYIGERSYHSSHLV